MVTSPTRTTRSVICMTICGIKRRRRIATRSVPRLRPRVPGPAARLANARCPRTTSLTILLTSPSAVSSRPPWLACCAVRCPRLQCLCPLLFRHVASRPSRFGVIGHQRRCASPPEPSSAHRGRPMAPLPHDEDLTSWLQLLSAIEEALAGRGTARLIEVCLSVYGALAAAQFQIAQLRATVHLLAAACLART
jgi:hypothetical protein